MTALLWARPVFGAILLAVVGLYIWTGLVAVKYEPERGPGYKPRYKP
jgi:hypothetical protein